MQFSGIELFLDDEMISYTRNIRREIRQPRKHKGNPIITGEYPWEDKHVTVYGSVLPDEERGVLRMWYNAYGQDYYNQQMMAYAESEDGISWTKPMMDYCSWPGHTKTNLLMGPDPNLHGPCVIRNPDTTDTERRFLLLFDSYEQYHPDTASLVTGRACYAAESPDGFRWNPAKGRLAFDGKADSAQCVIWEPSVEKFRAYARLTSQDAFGQRIRIFRLIESPDFVNWEEPRELIRPDAQDGGPDTQLQQLAVTRFDGIYVGLLGLFRIQRYVEKGSGGIDEGNQLDDIQLVTSRDGVRFTRAADRAIFLPKSLPPNWGTGGQRMASHMLLHNDTVFIYYGSRGQDAAGNPVGGIQIGLATLPRDRFVAMLPERLREEGLVELVPLTYTDDGLLLNTTVLPGGQIRGELADFGGNVIPGFEKENAQPITESGLDQPIQWKDGVTGKNSRGSPIRLRLWVRHAHVHALRSGG